MHRPGLRAVLFFSAAVGASTGARAETGQDLWLRYVPLEDVARRQALIRSVSQVVVEERTPTARIVDAELRRGLTGLLGVPIEARPGVEADGAVVVGTPAGSPLIASLGWGERLAALGDEGYLIRSARIGAHAGDRDRLARARRHALRGLPLPAARADRAADRGRSTSRRGRGSRAALLNHWDNLDGTIERGYAGRSLWKWDELPGRVDPRVAGLRARERVHRHQRHGGQQRQRQPAVAERGVSREDGGPGRRVPALRHPLVPVGQLRRAEDAWAACPPRIPWTPPWRDWWRDKADEIYRLIPDFGGFVVKANSEGQPGPQDYGRTHADGANVLADAVAPHGGIVMWRAFVYDAEVDPDRVKRAYLEFVPLDGRFRDNVFVQVKNGPLDFMPREPFHPALRRHAEDADHGRAADHAGVPGPLEPPRLPRADVEGVPRRGHLRQGAGLDGGAGRGRHARGRTRGPASRAWPTRAATPTGRATTSRRPTGTPTAAWPGIPALAPDAIADEWIRMTWGHAPEVVATIRADDAATRARRSWTTRCRSVSTT